MSKCHKVGKSHVAAHTVLTALPLTLCRKLWDSVLCDFNFPRGVEIVKFSTVQGQVIDHNVLDQRKFYLSNCTD